MSDGDAIMDDGLFEGLTGTSVGRIRLGERIGQGGMGEVYQGFDEILERRVAVKVLKGAKRALASQKARFLREAKALSSLDHPNICKILDYVASEDRHVLILEFVAGVDLNVAIRRGLTESDKHRLARQITDALVAAHAHDIIHRDLKPENVMVTSEGNVKVLDFGLARWVEPLESSGASDDGDPRSSLGDSGPSLTLEGTVLGTPSYLSPEQAAGQRLTTQSDVYALGLLLQEIFTGQPAIRKDLDLRETLKQAALGLSQPLEGIDRDYADLIGKMKSLAPAERPTARAVADRLVWISDRPKRRRRKWISVGVAAFLVLGTVVSSLGFILARRSEKAARAAQNKAEAVNRFLQDMLASADPWMLGLDVKVSDVLRYASENIDADFGDHPLHRAAVLHALGHTYFGMGHLDQARDHLERAQQIRMELLGRDHPDTLDTGTILAGVIDSQGHHERGEQVHRSVVADLKRVFDPNHPKTLEAENSLVLALDAQGKYEEAEALARTILDKAQETLGDKHDQTLAVMNNLAIVLDHQGDSENAERLYRKILSHRANRQGPNHPATLLARHNLASVVGDQGRVEEAIEIYRDVSQRCKKTFGDNHPITLASAANLANELQVQGFLEEAEAIQRRALETMQDVLGADHPQTLTCMGSLGRTLSLQGRLQAAIAMQQRVVALSEEKLSDDHPSTLLAMNNLAISLTRQGELTRAESVLRKVVAGREKALGTHHLSTCTAINNLAYVLFQQEKYAESESQFRRQLTLLEESLGPGHRETIYAHYTLGRVLEQLGRVEEAIAEYRIAAQGELIDAQVALTKLDSD